MVKGPASIRYDVAEGPTALDHDVTGMLDGLPSDPVELCAVAAGLVVLPDAAAAAGLADERQAEASIREASDILRLLRHLDERPLTEARPASTRVVGTCRHLALLACAFLRHRSIAARCRAGFASYFEAGLHVDHWVVEHHDVTEGRWVRVDPEALGLDLVGAAAELAPHEFLAGGEAWLACREGRADPATFGVAGVPQNFGIAEIRGNAVRDLAALNKVEVLPWDEWGRMTASYAGGTGPEYDALIDTVAAACASGDDERIRALYATEELTAPLDRG